MREFHPWRPVVAIILIVWGLGSLLDQLGIIPFGVLIGQWWPLAIVAIGVALLVRPNSDSFWPLVVVAIGILLLLGQLDYLPVNVWTLFWPVVLLLVGVAILTPHQQRAPALLSLHSADEPTDEEANDKRVNIETLFSGQDRKIDIEDFEGGHVSSQFGMTKLDLRQATMAENATLDINVAFGGVEILVPEDCRVVIEGTPVLGGWEDKTVRPVKPSQTLRLVGSCVCGGISVKN